MTTTPMMPDDNQLLREFLQAGSSSAFEQLVRRHIGMVYAAARRQVRDPDLAEDVTQAVFIVLVQKAPTLQNMPTIGGWLLRVTRYAAIDAMRKQNRTRRHEQLASQQRPEQVAAEPMTQDWERLAPVLDDAMSRLGAADRDAVVLRYFQDESYATIARKLGVREEAARKRVDRALEKLRGTLSRKGVTLSAAAIAGSLATHASAAIPPALVSSIVTGLSGATATTAAEFSIAKGVIAIMTWTKIKIGAAVAIGAIVVLGAATALIVSKSAAPSQVAVQGNAAPAPSTTAPVTFQDAAADAASHEAAAREFVLALTSGRTDTAAGFLLSRDEFLTLLEGPDLEKKYIQMATTFEQQIVELSAKVNGGTIVELLPNPGGTIHPIEKGTRAKKDILTRTSFIAAKSLRFKVLVDGVESEVRTNEMIKVGQNWRMLSDLPRGQ